MFTIQFYCLIWNLSKFLFPQTIDSDKVLCSNLILETFRQTPFRRNRQKLAKTGNELYILRRISDYKCIKSAFTITCHFKVLQRNLSKQLHSQ